MTRRVRMLALVLALFAACKKSGEHRKSPLQDATVVPVEAAALPTDAPPPPPKATPIDVAVAGHSACAVMSDGTLRCWGDNADGQLGDGTQTDAVSPVSPKLRGVKQVVFGRKHACARLDDDSVTCWGDINFGKTGRLATPTAAPGVGDAKRLFAVGGASCATTASGALVCWGDVDVEGHLRLAGAEPEHRVPTPVVGLDHVVALSVNGALREDGSVVYWGADGVPIATALDGVVELASAGDQVCGRRADGTVACVGPHPSCAAAASKPVPPRPAPTPARPAKGKAAKGKASKTKPAAKPRAAARALVVETLHLPRARHLAFDVGRCVVTTGGELVCLAASDPCKVDSPWPGLAKVDQAAGHCARLTTGAVKCWEVERKSRTVTAIGGVAGAAALAGMAYSCALLADKVACWDGIAAATPIGL